MRLISFFLFIFLIGCSGNINVNDLFVQNDLKIDSISADFSTLTPQFVVSNLIENKEFKILFNADSSCENGILYKVDNANSTEKRFTIPYRGLSSDAFKIRVQSTDKYNKSICSNEVIYRFNIAKDFDQVSAGYNHVCGVKLNKVFCWGNNQDGQLGDESIIRSLIPKEVSRLNNIKKVVTGNKHSCALTVSGHVYCWGNNLVGQLGNGSNTSSKVPTLVQSLENVIDISLSNDHTCAILNSGVLKCWGRNSFGQLGDNSNVDRVTPVEVNSVANFNSVEAGYYHTCGTTNDNKTYCWGYNGFGQLGSGDTNQHLVPNEVTSLTSLKKLALGVYHTCALLSNQSVKCFGANNYGQLGNGTNSNSNTPILIENLSEVQKISSSYYHTCVVVSSGQSFCWGINGNFQVGTYEGYIINNPKLVNIPEKISDITVGAFYTCATLQNKAVRCWGYNGFGQFGDQTTSNVEFPFDIDDSSEKILDIQSGDRHNCFLTSNFHVKCLGSNWLGQFGDNSFISSFRPSKTIGEELYYAISIGAGNTTCGIIKDSSRSVKCWGTNESGQLGDGTTINKNYPVAVSGLINVVKIAVGNNFACAVLDNSSVKCWGANNYGQLGNGTNTNSNSPVDVSNLSNVKELYVGAFHACAVTVENNLKCWGGNNYGQLGDGTTINRNNAVDITVNASRPLQLSLGSNHSCAIDSSNDLFCWGQNSYGQLGIGNFDQKLVPTKIIGDVSFKQVVASSGHTCAIDTNDNVYCWGLNNNYQLGDTTNLNKNIPTRVINLVGIPVKLSSKNANVCALMSTGDVKCWGANAGLQSGIGLAQYSYVLKF